MVMVDFPTTGPSSVHLDNSGQKIGTFELELELMVIGVVRRIL